MMAAGIVPASRTAVGTEREKPCQENSADAEKGDQGFSLQMPLLWQPRGVPAAAQHHPTKHIRTKPLPGNGTATHQQHHLERSGNTGVGIKATHTLVKHCCCQGTWADRAGAHCFQCSPGQSAATLPCTRVHVTQLSLERLQPRRLTQMHSCAAVPPLLIVPLPALGIFIPQDRGSPRHKALWVSQQDRACHFSVTLSSYMQSTAQQGDFAGRLLWGKGGGSRDKN